MSKIVVLVFGLLPVVGPGLFCGCEVSSRSARGDGLPRVLATTGMIGDIAKRIAGPYAEVSSLMGPGVDPHLYKVSEGDVRRLEAADLVLYNGLNLEGKMANLLVKLARNRRVLAVCDGIPRERLLEPPEFAGHYDPHIWFDVGLWISIVDPIRRELSELSPDHAGEYARNAGRVVEDLKSLDAQVAREIGSVPASARVLVTAHDAFGYFGKRYGIEVVGLQGMSTVSEAAIQDVERVVNLIVKRRVKAIFVESSVPRRTVEAVQKACAAKGHDARIGGELFSDAMGRAGTPEGNYRGMVEHNVRTIVEALE